MNWEPFPPEHIVRPLGEIDPEVGVFKLVDVSGKVACLLFNHAGHPNVLSGDNYLISAEYPGFAERLLEEEFGGTAIFVNGAQGTMDIDGLGPRDWAELERLGRKLAKAVAETARIIQPSEELTLRCANVKYGLPARKISDTQLAWAEEILKQTGGKVQPLADGVGDDYKAVIYKRMYGVQHLDIPVEQVCIALDETAFIRFPRRIVHRDRYAPQGSESIPSNVCDRFGKRPYRLPPYSSSRKGRRLLRGGQESRYRCGRRRSSPEFVFAQASISIVIHGGEYHAGETSDQWRDAHSATMRLQELAHHHGR
jgi:hypothetical protein